LATGVLTGKYDGCIPGNSRAALKGHDWLTESVTDHTRLEVARRLSPLAAELGCTLAQLAIAWCLTNPLVSTVITGASRVDQVRENMRATEVVSRLTPDLLQRIDRVAGTPVRPTGVGTTAAGWAVVK
jgi:aryl-alcohol dehydrogenase-like predicted oxidoreductase